MGESGYTTAVWNVGLLHYNYDRSKWIRISDRNVGLKFLCNSQDTIELLNKVRNLRI